MNSNPESDIQKLEQVINKFREETIESIVKKYSKEEISNIQINDLLISQIENMNLNENEQKMFDFISRMSSLSLNKESSSLSLLNPPNPEQQQITIEIDKNNIAYSANYSSIIHHLSCKNDPNLINNWLSPLTLHNEINSNFIIPLHFGKGTTRPAPFQSPRA